jgi:hypothetical protein
MRFEERARLKGERMAQQSRFFDCQEFWQLAVDEKVLLLRLGTNPQGDDSRPWLCASLAAVSAVNQTERIYPALTRGQIVNLRREGFSHYRFWESVIFKETVAQVSGLWFINGGVSVALPLEPSTPFAWIAKVECSDLLLQSIPWLTDGQRSQISAIAHAPCA